MAQVQQEQPSSLAVASGRFKYADPRSLPSYPSRGVPREATASAAAALGWAKNRNGSLSMPRPIREKNAPSSAAAAASFATDPKKSQRRAKSVREPPTKKTSNSLSTTAHRHSFSQDNWGSSAAYLAFKSQSSQSKPSSKPLTHLESRSSLAAAHQATTSRPRSMSSPLTKQRGAGLTDTSETQRWSFVPELSPSAEYGSIPTTMLDRSMYTSNPPVNLEVEEKRKADELHSSAVALARQVFLKQQKMTEQHAHGYEEEDDDDNILNSGELGHSQPMNLHEAAYKLAQERLAKLQEEFEKNREFRDRYNPNESPTPPRHRVTKAFRLRNRSSSDSDLQLRRSNRTSHVTSIFPSPKTKIDEDQRIKDRAAVLATARRNVQSQLRGIDENICDRTGKIPPSKLTEWNTKAQALAQAKVASDMPPRGKRDVGGGMYVAQDEINAVAARNVQPLLKEIEVRAEKEQERQRILKEEQAAKQLEAEKEKAHRREVKDNYRKLKEGQKQREKERRQVLKEEERERKNGEKVSLKEDEDAALHGGIVTLDNRNLTGSLHDGILPVEMPSAHNSGKAITPEQTYALPPAIHDPEATTTPRSVTPVEGDSPGDGKEPTLSPGKVKNWIKAKLSRSRASSKTLDESEKGFIGGYAAKIRTPGGSTHSLVPISSMREMALVGRDRQALGEGRVTNEAVDDATGAQLTRELSVSSGGSDDRFVDARETQSPATLSPLDKRAVWTPPIEKSRNPGRDSRFREIID